MKLPGSLMIAHLLLCSTMSWAGMRPPVEHETPPPLVNPPATGSTVTFSYRDIFFDLLARGGRMSNYGSRGSYLYSDDLFIDALIAVKGREGEMCYFGVFKNAGHEGIVRAATGFQCFLPEEGGTGGSAGTGNLNQFQVMTGSVQVLDSISDFPAEISLEYKD